MTVAVTSATIHHFYFLLILVIFALCATIELTFSNQNYLDELLDDSFAGRNEEVFEINLCHGLCLKPVF